MMTNSAICLPIGLAHTSRGVMTNTPYQLTHMGPYIPEQAKNDV